MAFTACANHGGRYAGGANSFFLRLVRGNAARGGKLQVCGSCASLWLDYLAAHAAKVSEGDRFLEFEEPLACANDGGSLGNDPWTFYGNAYPRGMAESQWYARVCDVCADAVAEDLKLDSATARRV
jgi:hypothetical protein